MLTFSIPLALFATSGIKVSKSSCCRFALFLFEAMSMQCAIVASDTEPVIEIIKDNENGLLIPFYDIKQLSQKITHVIDNKNTKEIKEIKERARQTVVDKYDLQKLLPRHVGITKTISTDKG